MGKQIHKTIYLVDLENVHGSWAGNIDGISPCDQVWLFSSVHGALPDRLMPLLYDTGAYIKEVSCRNGTANAMDFCIVSALGFMIAENSRDSSAFYSYRILSGDHGYDVMIPFWEEFDIQRIEPFPISMKSLSEQERIMVDEAINRHGYDALMVQNLCRFMEESMCMVPVKRLQYIFTNLRDCYGTAGEDCYREMKSMIKPVVKPK